MRNQLTEAMIDKLGAPPTGRLEIFDAVVPALALRVTSGGAKSFVVRARIKGQTAPIRVTLGDAMAMKLADAREEASNVLRACRTGKDPREPRSQAKAVAARDEALKWENVAAEFIKRHYAKKRTGWRRQVEALLDKRVTPRWRGRLLSEITRADVVTLLDAIEQDSLYQANRTLACIRKLFNWALLRGLIDVSPIVPGMAREGEKARTRFLSFDEIRIVWRAAERLGHPFGPFVRFLLATGQRRGDPRGSEAASAVMRSCRRSGARMSGSRAGIV